METFLYLNSGRLAAADNMALDEAMLEAMPRLQRPLLRFYGWTEPAATFGYFQKYTEVAATTPLRPLVRRPTGGGMVPHDCDWTYAVAFPPGHAWYELKAEESYRRIHDWLREAFARLNIPTELAPCCKKTLPGQCFIGYEKYDLLWHGRKIAGAAQRRNKLGLLIQGSLQCPVPELAREKFEEAMVAAQAVTGPITWAGLALNDPVFAAARQLAAEKYSVPAYNEKR